MYSVKKATQWMYALWYIDTQMSVKTGGEEVAQPPYIR